MSCLDFSFSCAILQNRALSDARILMAKVFLYLYMTPCCVSCWSLQVFFYFYIRTSKIHSETSKNKSMAFQKFIQCSGSCFSSSHWFWWVHSNQITVLHFQGTPLPFGNEVCLMLRPRMPQAPGLWPALQAEWENHVATDWRCGKTKQSLKAGLRQGELIKD